jgi:hypothetical protein
MGFEFKPLFKEKKAYGYGSGYATLTMGQADLTGGQHYT